MQLNQKALGRPKASLRQEDGRLKNKQEKGTL